MNPIDEILENYAERALSRFDEENVTQRAHALQCAALAEQAGASPALITACLLHDIGHLINPDALAAINRGEDAEHEERAARYLAPWFNDDVLQPIRWHVDAKRYLTATDGDYFAKLSQGSVRSLEVQGGPFSEEEVAEFEARPYHGDAVRLRRWDEGAKSPSARTPPIEHFRQYIEAALKPELRG
jgi:phosphonate degradation associated HDIG domain protein